MKTLKVYLSQEILEHHNYTDIIKDTELLKQSAINHYKNIDQNINLEFELCYKFEPVNETVKQIVQVSPFERIKKIHDNSLSSIFFLSINNSLSVMANLEHAFILASHLPITINMINKELPNVYYL